MTTYQQVGGLKTFRRLARVFYARVTRDPLLKPLFSKETDKQIEQLALFLAETFGGPKRYSQQHGRRKLQEMHAAFPIGAQEIQAWKKHGVGRGIVVGRLQRDGVLEYWQGSNLMQKLEWGFVTTG
jgi:truncated hemoglobin YjbI